MTTNNSGVLSKASLNRNLSFHLLASFSCQCLTWQTESKDWYWYLFYILQQAPPSQLIFYKLSRNDSNLESTILGIHFPITQQHFVRGKLKVNWHRFFFSLSSSSSLYWVFPCAPFSIKFPDWRNVKFELILFASLSRCFIKSGSELGKKLPPSTTTTTPH